MPLPSQNHSESLSVDPPLPEEVQCNSNNSKIRCKNADANEKPFLCKLTTTSESKTKEAEASNLESKRSGEPINIPTSTSAANLQLSDDGLDLEENQKTQLKFVEKQTHDMSYYQQNILFVHMEHSPESQGAALRWIDQNDVRNRYPYFVETSEICTSKPLQFGLSTPQALTVLCGNESSSSAKKSDADAISFIRKGIVPMREILSNRIENLEILRDLLNSGDIMTSVNFAVRMKDQSVIVYLLNMLIPKPELWNLNLCVLLLPQIRNLIISNNESYTCVGCHTLKLILKYFSDVIRSNLKAPPPKEIDYSREERHHKCISCYAELKQIKKDMLSKQQASGKIGCQFQELEILFNTLES